MIKTNCAGCKYWRRSDTAEAAERNYNLEYLETPPDLSIGLCTLAKFAKNGNEIPNGWEDDAPRTIDGSGFYAALWTKDNYGCTLGEPATPVDTVKPGHGE